MIGCGKMGGALLKSWIKSGDDYTIVDPGLEHAPDGAKLVKSKADLADSRFDVIVVAIKPQMIDDILPDYSDMLAENGYLLSIAAGCSIARLKKAFDDQPVVRVMPNLPAAIGQGVSGICPGPDAGDAQITHARALMEHAGSVVVLDDEDALDRFTAIAGSGPGYVFELARTYVAAAMELGFDEPEAREMVLGTLAGTVAMARHSDEPLEELRNSVTSKNGTTAAGLDALNGGGDLDRLLQATTRAAYDRAVEMR